MMISNPSSTFIEDLERRVMEARRAIARLTARQKQVLQGVVHGDSNKQIARDLHISPRTVEIHRVHMMARLEARTTADAVRIAIYAEIGEPSA
jgi:FixJ family two-component response regulator